MLCRLDINQDRLHILHSIQYDYTLRTLQLEGPLDRRNRPALPAILRADCVLLLVESPRLQRAAPPLPGTPPLYE